MITIQILPILHTYYYCIILQVDDPATAELLAMLGINTGGAASSVAIDCTPVDLRI